MDLLEIIGICRFFGNLGKLVTCLRFVGISDDERTKAFTHLYLHDGIHAGMNACMHGWIGCFGGLFAIRGDKRR